MARALPRSHKVQCRISRAPRSKSAPPRRGSPRRAGDRRAVWCGSQSSGGREGRSRSRLDRRCAERQLAKGDKALVGNAGYRRYLKMISDDHTSRSIPTRSWRTASSTASSCCAPIPTSIRSRPCSALPQARRDIRGHVFCSFLALVRGRVKRAANGPYLATRVVPRASGEVRA
jgi:hypothetical protein